MWIALTPGLTRSLTMDHEVLPTSAHQVRRTPLPAPDRDENYRSSKPSSTHGRHTLQTERYACYEDS